MGILDILVEDIIFRILSFTDVPTILSTSQTCQYLHTLAFSRPIWVKCLSDINSRLSLDIPDSLESLSTSALIALVKMAVVGPQSWPPTAANGPVASRRLSNNTKRPFLSSSASIKIVPGGRYVLILVDRNLECRRTSDGICTWKYDPTVNDPKGDVSHIRTFDVDLMKGGHGINIIAGIDTQQSNRIELIHLDPSTGVSSVLFTFRTAIKDYDSMRSSRIRGNLAMIHGVHDRIVLINLETQSALHLSVAHYLCQIDIIPGNFLALCTNRDDYTLAVWHAESFTKYSSFVGGTRSNPITIKMPDMLHPPTDVIPIPCIASDFYPPSFSVHEHPLHPGLYALWVSISCQKSTRKTPRPAPGPSSAMWSARLRPRSRPQPPPYHRPSRYPKLTRIEASSDIYPVHVAKYRISLHPESQQCSVHLLYSAPKALAHPHNWVGFAGISFAGHATSDWHSYANDDIQLPEQAHLISLDLHSKSDLTLGGAPDFLHFPHVVVHVSPYSGTLWYVDETEDQIVMEYYQ